MFSKYLLPIFLLFAPIYLHSSTWNNSTTTDSWNDSANWDPVGVVNSSNSVADFILTLGLPNVDINAPIELSTINFNSPDDYSINGPASLTVNNGQINVVSNTTTNTIAANTQMILKTPLQITNTSGNPLTILANIVPFDGVMDADITFKSGVTILGGTNTYRHSNISFGATFQADLNNALSLNTMYVDGDLVLTPLIGSPAIVGLRGSTTGAVNLNDNTLNLHTGNFAGKISGTGGINKSAYHPLTLSGMNTYTGLTTIFGGIINVTGSITSDVVVNAPDNTNDPFLTGPGVITGSVTNSGTVSPGALKNTANGNTETSIGTLTVNGTYTQDSTGDLMIQVSDDGSSDRLNVSGNATLDGTLTLDLEPGIYPAGSRFTFMNYAARGGALTLLDDSSLDFSIFYLGTSALLINDLQGAILPIPKRLLSGNSRQVADYLFCRGFLPSNHDLLRVMGALVRLPDDQFAKDLVKLSPAQFGALPLTNLHSNRIIADVIVENTEKFDWCDPCDSQKECEVNETSVWIAPVGYYYDQDGIQSQIGFDAYAVGVGVGASHLFFNSFHVGGGAGYTYSKIDWDKDRGDGHVNSVYLGPSLGWSQKNAFLNLLVMGSYNYYDIDRNIEFPGVNRTASNKHHSYDVLARLDGGYRFRINTGGKFDHFFILPEARLSYLNIFEERYTESGADSINLTVDSKYSAFLQPNILVKFLRDFHTRTLCITPAFQVGWISNISLSSGNYKSRFYKQETCQPHFVVKSFTRNTNQLSLGLDVNIRHVSDWIIDVGYRVDFLDNNYVMDGEIKVEKRF